MDKTALKSHLYECLRREVMMSGKEFTWWRTIHRAVKTPKRRFIFWWRIASYLYQKNKKLTVRLAKHINRKLIAYYGTEIELGAVIGPGVTFAHHQGIVVSQYAMIGENLHLRQNVTIGAKTGLGNIRIIVGDNVKIGANSCIISDDITIGSNVDIGAMSFINKSIPNDCIVYTKKHNEIITRSDTSPSIL